MPEPGAPDGAGPFTCLLCGCLCDDLELVRDAGGRIESVRPDCPIATPWWAALEPPPAGPIAIVDGEPAERDAALAHVARLLRAARAPAILGLDRSTDATMAAALALGDRIGALVDAGDPRLTAPRLTAFQRVGAVSATLGEVRHRADVVVFWGADPYVTHPRHPGRYSVDASGRFLPGGRSDRTVAAVDRAPTETSRRADLFVRLDADRQFEALWTLRALARGARLDPGLVRRSTGVGLDELARLLAVLEGARYGAFFAGPMLDEGTPAAATAAHEAAAGLVRDLNAKARFVLLGLGGPGNLAGVESVACRQTGFASAVDLGAGHPESLPGPTSGVRRLVRGEVDLLVLVGPHAAEMFPPGAVDALARIPTLLIAPPGACPSLVPAVRLHAGRPGVEERGTVARADGLALPLRAAFDSPLPSEGEWLAAILARLEQGG